MGWTPPIGLKAESSASTRLLPPPIVFVHLLPPLPLFCASIHCPRSLSVALSLSPLLSAGGIPNITNVLLAIVFVGGGPYGRIINIVSIKNGWRWGRGWGEGGGNPKLKAVLFFPGKEQKN